LIDSVFRERMVRWHFADSGDFEHREEPLRDALDWWLGHLDLDRAAEQVGVEGLASSLAQHGLVALDELPGQVDAVLDRSEQITIGPVHGDLHAQNILVGTDGAITLIDYGWTSHRWRAVDFLMLECSLKFLVSPPHARLEDLMLVEELLEEAVETWPIGEWGRLVSFIHGRELAKIGAAIQAVRACALTSEAVTGPAQYRRGLIALTAALASLPSEINRVYLVHSLAFNLGHAR